MPTTRKPRCGSMQFWPRKRAKRVFARVRAYKKGEAGLLGFAGYKAGMTHCMVVDNSPTSMTKGEDIFCPVTVIECPPIKIASIRFYKKTPSGLQLRSEIFSKNVDKELGRRIILAKKESKKLEDFEKDVENFDDVRVLVHTQPKLTGIGKKKPEIFEMQLGGDIKTRYEYAKNNLGKEIKVNDVLKEGEQIDVHSISKGKGFQGAVKRFGVSIKQHKSEKTKRGVGNLGAWTPHHTSYRTPQPGKMGYHTRTEYNKWLIKIGEDGAKVTPRGGFVSYGNVKNSFVLLKGSVIGSKKRLVRLNLAIRPNKGIPREAPIVAYVSTRSKQGN